MGDIDPRPSERADRGHRDAETGSFLLSGIPTSFCLELSYRLRSDAARLRRGAMRVALDAMGGDFAPGPIVAGACEAATDLPDLTVVLVGDQARIEAELAKAPSAARDRMPILHS